jgi:hypothetical protein
MSILSDEIDNDPMNKGYSAFLPDQPGHVVELLNALTETRYKTRIITARGILSDYAGGPVAAAVVMDKLDTAAPLVSALKWAWAFIKGEGIDIGHAATRGMLDQLVGGSVITADEAGKLKALALQPASRAEVLGLPYMTEELLRNR